ncbi:hypothetical protein D3C87_1499420 [compost metagenome]
MPAAAERLECRNRGPCRFRPRLRSGIGSLQHRFVGVQNINQTGRAFFVGNERRLASLCQRGLASSESGCLSVAIHQSGEGILDILSGA